MDEKQEDPRVIAVATAMAKADGRHDLLGGGDERRNALHFAPFKREAARFLAALDAATKPAEG